MAKKTEAGREERLAPFFDAELRLAERRMGRHNLMVGDDAEKRKYGIEIPSIALQYVLGSNVLFMEQLIMLAGPPKAHKSSFAFEIARWVINHDGYARLYDTELKYSPKLAGNLIGPRPNYAWQVRNCETSDIWQEMFGEDLALYRDFWKIGKSLKRGEKREALMPVALIIDSLTGRTTAASIKSYEKEGVSSNTQGMRTAKAISDFLQIQNFTYLPFYVIFIRHEKEGGMDSSGSKTFMTGPKPKKTPGGSSPDYIGGYDLRFNVSARDRSANSGWNLIRMRCNKNAFGVDRLQCYVRFSWQWMDIGGDSPEQIPKWEWDLATAEFLAGFDRADIKDICHVVQGGSKNQPSFNCKQLGVKEVTGNDLGLALRSNPEIFKALQDYLHVERWPAFDPHMSIPDPTPKK